MVKEKLTRDGEVSGGSTEKKLSREDRSAKANTGKSCAIPLWEAPCGREAKVAFSTHF